MNNLTSYLFNEELGVVLEINDDNLVDVTKNLIEKKLM